MALAFDAVSSASGTSASPSVSHTTAGSNRILYVGIWNANDGNNVSAITYGGVAMTLITSFTASNGSGWAGVYYLANPTSGSNTISITLSGSQAWKLAGASYTGAAGVAPTQSGTSGSGGNGNWTEPLTSTANNSWHIGFCSSNSANNWTAGAGTTLRIASSSFTFVDNNAAITPAAANTIGANRTSSNTTQALTFIIAPFNGATLTESVSETDRVYTGKIFREVVTLSTVILKTFAETITLTDGTSFEKLWKALTKAITSWSNQNKS